MSENSQHGKPLQQEWQEYNDRQGQKTQHRQNSEQERNGRYSPNQCFFFAVLTLIILIPFLGQRLAHPVQNIKRASLKNIYSALTAPIVSVTESSPVAAVIPVLRNAFIRTARLTERSEWDTFFYHQGVYDSEVAAFYAVTGEQGYIETIPGFSDNLSGGGLPAELFGQVSKEMLRNVALPVVHSARMPLRLFFFGDSQMRSIAAGMTRALGSDSSIAIRELSVPSSGFLRSDYYNWPQKLEAVFAVQKDGERFDAVVAFLGMNDYQDMWTTGGIILTAGSPEWEEVYRKMVKVHLDTALASVPRLYWLGLPVVRSAAYNEKMQYLNAVHDSIAEEYDSKKLVRISLKSLVEQYGTGYIGAIKPEGSAWIPLMQSDGIHYTIEGGEYLMKRFIDRLHRDYVFR
ncbi:DUF459 domain-containing protein [Treponema medium]|uniref:SGNH hydrolase-type esterase domain-containing protein n=2 Tax=Treponema medium TaxID=58231 RepID=A0AA87NP45_TREMD|nr:DUF459 domain-containing protein [Treponema medium]EPF27788.1 hypothetical protein HMPREF9195_02289 [Treponema medium ATCC 700293]QSH98383.1 DUF459 domain-containing protein [Treponema medium]